VGDRAAQREQNARRAARQLVMQALYQWQLAGQDPKDILLQFREDRDYTRADTEYFEAVLLGVTGEVGRLDAALAPLIERGSEGIDPVERAILRLAAYELFDRPELPYRVVVNEAVALAKRFGAEQSYRFVNGVLDQLARSARPQEVGAAG
jgi:N utilization substance protein B